MLNVYPNIKIDKFIYFIFSLILKALQTCIVTLIWHKCLIQETKEKEKRKKTVKSGSDYNSVVYPCCLFLFHSKRHNGN